MSGLIVLAFPIARLVSAWRFDPTVVVVLVVAGWGYERGRHRLRASVGAGRVVSAGGVVSFWVGLALIGLALLSPLGRLDDVMFSVHMTQHLVLGLVAPLFIVMGRPLTVASWGLGAGPRRRLEHWRWRLLPPSRFRRSAPLIGLGAVAVHVGAWWVWHLPVVFDAALANDYVHDLEHLTLLGAGVALWWPALGVRWRERVGLGILAVFVASLGTGMLSGLVVLTNHTIYTVSPELRSWGVNPLSDQWVGGALMWVPGGIVYLVVAVVLLVRWLERGPARVDGRPAPPTGPATLRAREPA